jgi:hypothetical protein
MMRVMNPRNNPARTKGNRGSQFSMSCCSKISREGRGLSLGYELTAFLGVDKAHNSCNDQTTPLRTGSVWGVS